MRYLHPAALGGLLLNVAVAFILYTFILGVDLSLFEGDQRDMLEALVEVFMAARPLYYGMLAAQAVALVLIVTGFGFGLGIAVASAVFMLPGSLVYIIGSALTYFRVRYAGFYKAPPDCADAHFVFPAFALSRARIVTGVFFLSTLICIFFGSYDVSIQFLAFSFTGLYGMRRAARNHALSLHDDYMTLSPGLFADRLLIPYTNITGATLNDDETIDFEVQSTQGIKNMRWRLRTIEPAQRRAALEEMAAALAAHDVPLY